MRPTRESIQSRDCTYFVSTQTADRKPFFRHERWARLIIATLRHYSEEDFTLHAFVIMPDHLHLLLTPAGRVERAIQLIKGGFSFHARKEFGWNGEIWQKVFTDHRIRNEEDWVRYVEYIRMNPVRAQLADDPACYPFLKFPDIAFPQAAKAALHWQPISTG